MLSVLSDDILGEEWFWPNSTPASQMVPDAAILNARDVASRVHQDMMPNGGNCKGDALRIAPNKPGA